MVACFGLAGGLFWGRLRAASKTSHQVACFVMPGRTEKFRTAGWAEKFRPDFFFGRTPTFWGRLCITETKKRKKDKKVKVKMTPSSAFQRPLDKKAWV